jgi:eukaryotic-like serine/threonine-protein kinase
MSLPPLNSFAPVKEGDVLDGKYLVEKVLGLGGMGVVVAAKHLQLEQRVAIKFVLPHAVGDAEAMERFAREARAAVKLRSEHVARVLDVGTLANGAPYMVMEYLAGSDLGAMIQTGGPLGHVDAVDFVLQACEAIAEAHANGIIHRDLKPQNLFVTHAVDGKPLVKVLDFGISKQTSLGGSGKDLSLTRTSSVMGSPNYMSPEQLKSTKSVDARTDIWALGVILFEVLTTRVPFEAESVTQLTAMVLQDTPRRVNELRTDVPPGLAQVIARCLEKDPAMRYASVADLARDLEPFGSQRGVSLRIAQVAGSRGVVQNPRSTGKVATSGATSVAWEDTQLSPPPKRRMALAVTAGVALLVVVAGGAVAVGVRLGHSSAAVIPPLEVTPTVRQIDLAAVAPSVPAAVPPSPPPLPSASASAAVPAPTASVQAAPPAAAAQPSASSPPLATPKPHSPTHSHAPANPKPANAKRGGDDFPDERN